MNLRLQLRELQDEHDIVTRQIDEQEGQQSRPAGSSPARKKPVKNNLAGLMKKKMQLDKKISRKKYELEVELPDQARKADAYPGWIRE
jgi:protein-arginine kinase activator protein McsA